MSSITCFHTKNRWECACFVQYYMNYHIFCLRNISLIWRFLHIIASNFSFMTPRSILIRTLFWSNHQLIKDCGMMILYKYYLLACISFHLQTQTISYLIHTKFKSSHFLLMASSFHLQPTILLGIIFVLLYGDYLCDYC